MADKSLTFNIFGKDVSGSKAIAEFQEKSSAHIGSLVKALGGLAIGYLGVSSAIDFGKQSVEAAMTAQTATQKLSVALENTKSTFKATGEEVTSAQDKMEKFGYTGAQVSDALAVMTTGMGSGSKALQYLGVAADLARYKNIDLSDAALVVTKGLEGQLKPLKALGIDLPVYAGNAQAVALANKKVATEQAALNAILAKYPDAATAGAKGNSQYEAAAKKLADAQDVANQKVSSGTQIIGALSSKVNGEAAKSADTYAGKWKVVGAQWDDIEVKVGNALLPALQKIADFTSKDAFPALKAFADGDYAKGFQATGKALGDFYSQWYAATAKNEKPSAQALVNFDRGQADNVIAAMKAIHDFWLNGVIIPLGQGWVQLGTDFSAGWNTIVAAFPRGIQQINAWFSAGIGEIGRMWNALITNGIVGTFNAGAARVESGWNQLTSNVIVAWARVASNIQSLWNNTVAAVGRGIAGMTVSVTSGVNQFIQSFSRFASFGVQAVNILGGAVGGLTGKFVSAFVSIGAAFANWVVGPINAFLRLIGQTQIRFPTAPAPAAPAPTPSSGGGNGGGSARAFAVGGIVRHRPGGLNAVIGEGADDEAVVPLNSANLAALGGGGSGTQVTINVNGFVAGSASDAAKGLYSLLVDGMKRGDIPRNVFG